MMATVHFASFGHVVPVLVNFRYWFGLWVCALGRARCWFAMAAVAEEPVTRWSIERVQKWISDFGGNVAALAPKFGSVGGKVLLNLTDERLLKMGIDDENARETILLEIADLKAIVQQQQPEQQPQPDANDEKAVSLTIDPRELKISEDRLLGKGAFGKVCAFLWLCFSLPFFFRSCSFCSA